MVAATGHPKNNFCMACYDGRYPVPYDPTVDKSTIERRNGRGPRLVEALMNEREQGRLL